MDIQEYWMNPPKDIFEQLFIVKNQNSNYHKKEKKSEEKKARVNSLTTHAGRFHFRTVA
jgi:hypothetical protein